jgi:hypothetical protein
MNRKYLPASIVVLIVSVAMILIPQSIEMHIAPELVTVWVDTVTTENVLNLTLVHRKSMTCHHIWRCGATT